MAILTVFTPAYNRAHTLPRTYASLQAQSCRDFVWLVVDDGSTDETAQLVRRWQEENNGFEIRYLYKENGGMHTAHNAAYENIDTELNVCIDSDDAMAPGAVEKILRCWEAVRDKGYAGLVGLDADLEGNLIGKGFPEELTQTTLSGYYAAGGSGDKKLVYRTDVINSYPAYPVFPGEKYVALAYKYLLIDQQYRLAVLPEVLCNVEYQADGSSRNMWRQYLTNPQGFAFWRTVQAQYPDSFLQKVKNCVHYCSSRQLAKEKGHAVTPWPGRFLPVLCAPLGSLLSAAIRRKAKG